MQEFLDILVQYGPYIGLAVIVAGIVQSLKLAFKKFFTQTTVGMRLMPFIPLVLGMVGGLVLPQETLASKLMVGGALGTMSSVIYNVITRTFARGTTLQQKIDTKIGNGASTSVEPMEPPAGPEGEVK